MRRFAFGLTSFALCLVVACEDQSLGRPSSSVPTIRDAGTPDAGGSASALRFATFNTHLFFDTACDSGQCQAASFEQVRTQAEFDEQTRLRARAIERLDADVIALQEVETQAAFDALVARLGADGFVYEVAQFAETGAGGSLDVAILARSAAVDAVKTHRDEPLTRADGSTTTFARELLEVRLTIAKGEASQKVVFFAAHFRSKAGGDDPGRRLAEAQRTRALLLAAATDVPEALVVLGGDLNDEPGSPPLSAIEEGGDLVRLANGLTADGTYVFQGQPQAIDHLVATAKTAERLVAGSAEIVRDSPTKGLGGSDHAAVAANLSLE